MVPGNRNFAASASPWKGPLPVLLLLLPHLWLGGPWPVWKAEGPPKRGLLPPKASCPLQGLDFLVQLAKTFQYIHEGVVYIYLYMYLHIILSPSVSQALSDWEVWTIIGVGVAGVFRILTKTMCLYTCTHAIIHAPYFLVCLGLYLSPIGSDQRDQVIYGIRRTYRTWLSK